VKSLDNLFNIRAIINDSKQPLIITDIVEITGLSRRTVQRYAMRLATEGLVDFNVKNRGRNDVGGMGYEFMRFT